MERARASVPPEAIRIEDEVWQEAFRERPTSRPRLRSLDGGRSPERGRLSERPRSPDRGRLPERARSPERVAVAGPRPVPRRVSGALTGRSPVPADAPVPAIAVELPTMAPGETPPGDSSPSAWAAPEPPGRRTITITGRGAERNLPVPSDASRRRSARKVHERAGFKPDRFAMWALFLGLLLLLVAATSAHV